MTNPNRAEWIYRALWLACIAALAADLLYDKHPTFAVEGWFGFYAWYSAICSVAVVLAARALRKLVTRREDYYDR